jgi:pimeloyl-ACP methyl ester carboxylesterase
MECDVKRIFVLLHGTFAPNAQWTIDGVLRRRLAKLGNVEFHTPQWPGVLHSRLNNGHRSRLAGATVVQATLTTLRKHNPSARIYVIAHSHGGNVAIYAANKLPPGTVNGIVCLSTPFIHIGVDLSIPQFVASRVGMVDNLLVLPWFALLLAIACTVGLYVGIGSIAAVIGSLVPPGAEAPISSLIPSWLAEGVLPVLLGLVVLAFLRTAYWGSIYLVSALLTATKNTVLHAAYEVSRADFTTLGCIPPPHVPCRWLFATSDEVAKLFSTLKAVTSSAQRISRILLWVVGVAAALAVGLHVYGAQLPESRAVAWVLGGWTFVLCGAALYLVLGLVGFLVSRSIRLLRSLFLGWENVLTTLFTSLEVEFHPDSHRRVEQTDSKERVKEIAFHSGGAIAVVGPWWRLSHSLYLDRSAVRDLTESIRIFEQFSPTRCEACECLLLPPLRRDDHEGGNGFRGTDIERLIGRERPPPIHHI